MKIQGRTGEVTQRLGTLAGLSGSDLGSLPSTHGAPHSVCMFSSRRSDVLFWPLQEPGTHMVYIYKCRINTHAHKIKLIKIFLLSVWEIEALIYAHSSPGVLGCRESRMLWRLGVLKLDS